MSEAALPVLSDDWALFLDVDGTILEIAATPDAVQVPAHALMAIAAAYERLSGAVALISGRSIPDLDRLFAPLKLPAAGSHGAQRRSATGRISGREDAVRLAPARALLTRWVRVHPGALLEDKQDSLALHYRNVPDLEPEARLVVTEAVAAAGPAFHVQEGKMVLEIKARATSKGRAIEEFMEEAPFSGRRPVFIGDDLTDEAGFEAVNKLGGYSIAVGVARPTRARWRLLDAPHVLRWLASQGARVGAAR